MHLLGMTASLMKAFLCRHPQANFAASRLQILYQGSIALMSAPWLNPLSLRMFAIRSFLITSRSFLTQSLDSSLPLFFNLHPAIGIPPHSNSSSQPEFFDSHSELFSPSPSGNSPPAADTGILCTDECTQNSRLA